MSDQQGNDLQQLTHLVDSLHRYVPLTTSTIVTASGLPSMASPVLLDLSSYISKKAEAVIISLFVKPNANSYWFISTNNTSPISPGFDIIAYASTINQWRSNQGIQKVSNQGFYYQTIKVSGGGNASWQISLNGYIESA
jgi:hypothetical protein